MKTLRDSKMHMRHWRIHDTIACRRKNRHMQRGRAALWERISNRGPEGCAARRALIVVHSSYTCHPGASKLARSTGGAVETGRIQQPCCCALLRHWILVHISREEEPLVPGPGPGPGNPPAPAGLDKATHSEPSERLPAAAIPSPALKLGLVIPKVPAEVLGAHHNPDQGLLGGVVALVLHEGGLQKRGHGEGAGNVSKSGQ